MATGSQAAEILKPVEMPHALTEFSDDTPSKRIAANAGEVLTEKVGGAVDVACDSGADHFDVVAFPIHLVATDRARGRLRDGVEISESEPKRGIGGDRATQRRHRLRRVHSLLGLAIKEGGPRGGGDGPTVILDRWTIRDRLIAPGRGILLTLVHDRHVGQGA